MSCCFYFYGWGSLGRLVPAVLVVGRRQLEVLVVVGVGLGVVVVDRAARAAGARRWRDGGLVAAALLRRRRLSLAGDQLPVDDRVRLAPAF